MDQLLEIVPLIVALLVPPLFAMVRKVVSIPPTWIPVILPATGGILATLGSMVGVEIDPAAVTESYAAFEAGLTGILVGAASVGFHQIKRQQDDDHQNPDVIEARSKL